MASHFIEKCRVCNRVITQCRRPDLNKPVRWAICSNCAQSREPKDPIEAENKRLRDLLKESKREHYSVEGDCYYSCPKHPNYCGNEDRDYCNCGADDWNARVDAALKEKT